MCGILITNKDGLSEGIFRKQLNGLKHRRPDAADRGEI